MKVNYSSHQYIILSSVLFSFAEFLTKRNFERVPGWCEDSFRSFFYPSRAEGPIICKQSRPPFSVLKIDYVREQCNKSNGKVKYYRKYNNSSLYRPKNEKVGRIGLMR